MANNSINLMKPHFFQPLKPGFQSKLSIPKAFLRHLRGDEKYFMLKDKRNGIWYVKVSYKEGKVHFKDGWRKFCEEHGLQVGDFLVFKYQGNLIFDVIVFDPSACERTFLQTSIVSSDIVPYACINEKGDVKIEHISHGGFVANVAFKPRGFPYYHTSVKLYWRKWGGMPIPMEFARKNDLNNRCCEMILIDAKEKSWSLSLKQNYTTTYIGGWRAFERSNDLKVGDPIFFELIHSGLKPIMKLYRLSDNETGDEI